MSNQKTLTRFSKEYTTSDAWIKAHPTDTPYNLRIKRGIAKGATTLTQARGHPKETEKPISKVEANLLYSSHPEYLSKKDQNTLKKITNTLKRMRKGESLSKACKNSKISPNTVKKHTENLVFKDKGLWKVKNTDSIQIPMEFWEKGKDTLTQIVPENSYERSKIGKYMNAVKNLIFYNNGSYLLEVQLEGIHGVKDKAGVFHKFEFDEKRLKELHEVVEGEKSPYEIEGGFAYV